MLCPLKRSSNEDSAGQRTPDARSLSDFAYVTAGGLMAVVGEDCARTCAAGI